jgi:CBS domain-containing membrane protein
MRVRDIMTTKVFTIGADKKAFVANEIMEWAHIRHIPVVDTSNRVVGIISHRDILRASLSALGTHFAEAERRQHLSGAPSLAIMHHPARTIGPDASVQEAAGMMRRFKFGCLPVVEENRLVGIVTEYDILRLVEQLPPDALTSGEPSAT